MVAYHLLEAHQMLNVKLQMLWAVIQMPQNFLVGQLFYHKLPFPPQSLLFVV